MKRTHHFASAIRLGMGLGIGLLVVACGAAKEISNSLNLPGHWLMEESAHSGKLERMAEKESMVLTFKDNQAAFSPTDSVKGRAVFATVSKCTAGPRPYRTDGYDIVFPAVTGCAEKRVTVKAADKDHLQFTDPDDATIERKFSRVDDARYSALVRDSDKRLK